MTYTVAEAKAVMAETQRLLDADRKRQSVRVTARASASVPPPGQSEPEPTPGEQFMDLVLEEMASGKRKSQAIREVATKRPDLHKSYLEEHNEQARAREQRLREKQAANRARFGR